MKIVVMKFGGTSLSDINRIKNVASIIDDNIKKYKLVIVLSAMAGVTNDLQNHIDQISNIDSSDSDMDLEKAIQALKRSQARVYVSKRKRASKSKAK